MSMIPFYILHFIHLLNIDVVFNTPLHCILEHAGQMAHDSDFLPCAVRVLDTQSFPLLLRFTWIYSSFAR